MKRDTCQLSAKTLLDVLVLARLVTSHTTCDITQGEADNVSGSLPHLTALVALNKRKMLRAWEKSGTRLQLRPDSPWPHWCPSAWAGAAGHESWVPRSAHGSQAPGVHQEPGDLPRVPRVPGGNHPRLCCLAEILKVLMTIMTSLSWSPCRLMPSCLHGAYQFSWQPLIFRSDRVSRLVIRTIGHGPEQSEQSTLGGTFNLFVVTNDVVSVSGAVTLLQ